MKPLKKILPIALLLLVSAFAFAAENWTPLPGDGTTPEWCDIASSGDIDKDGKTMPETLRDRIEKYNKSGSDSKCRFYMFFLFRNKTIVLKKPLTLENNPHDRDTSSKEVMTGTDISAYGPGGTSDLQGITVDARSVTKEEGSCTFVVKGGFEAMQQIHGLTLLVQKKTRAICDENGNDLMDATSLSCDGAKGRDCDFKDISVLVQPDSTGGTPDDDDADNDGVVDAKDLCKGDAVTGGEVGNYGCPNTKCVYFIDNLVGRLSLAKAVVKDKTGIDSDEDGIDDACDTIDNSPDPNPDPGAGGTTGNDGSGTFEDTDGDGLSDTLEAALGTDPTKADTDEDGTPDGSDCLPKDGSRHDCAALISPPDDTDDGNGETQPTDPDPSGSDDPPAHANKGLGDCALQLVAAEPDAFTGVFPFLMMGGGSLILYFFLPRR